MTRQAGFADLDRDSLQRAGRLVASVEGMWCASCALAVERIIAKSPGVTHASTSFSGGSALIQWDSSRFDLGDLLARVERLGYRLVPLVEADAIEQQIDLQTRAVWLRLAVALFFGMWSMLGTTILYVDSDLAASPEGWWVALVASIASLPVVTYSAWAFYRAGWRTLIAGVPGMDALISLGVVAASLLSAWQLWQGSAEVYVDTATMLVGFLLCGRLIELYARRRNSGAVNALRQAVPEMARRMSTGIMTEVPASSLQVGDCVLIYAGERITVDGMVIEGESDVDRSLVTGEAIPVAARPGDRVEAGCVNLSCALQVRVEQPYGKRFIDRIGIRMLELFGAKSSAAMQAERFARILIPAALGLSVLVFLYAYATGDDASQATLRALSVLVAACPCAVGLALPLAYASSAASAARHGILFRDPASMEALAQTKEVLFDKTGTLTKGTLEVVDIAAPVCGPDRALELAMLAETGIAHPVARAIRNAAKRAGQPATASPPAGKTQRFGQGVCWQSEDGQSSVLVGSRAWLTGHGVDVPDEIPGSAQERQGSSRVHVARKRKWLATLVLDDTLRADAAQALASLQSAEIVTRLVTGDSAEAAEAVAERVNLPVQHVHAGCLPEEKVAVVDAARRPVTFVGDGVNDALALAAADCGVAMKGAATAAVATAGVVIVQGGLDTVVSAWRHARATFRIVRQNLAFSMIYNVGILTLAATGTVPPVAAAAAMLASSVSVIANAARLTRFHG